MWRNFNKESYHWWTESWHRQSDQSSEYRGKQANRMAAVIPFFSGESHAEQISGKILQKCVSFIQSHMCLEAEKRHRWNEGMWPPIVPLKATRWSAAAVIVRRPPADHTAASTMLWPSSPRNPKGGPRAAHTYKSTRTQHNAGECRDFKLR